MIRHIQIVAPAGDLCNAAVHRVKRVVANHGCDCEIEVINDFKKSLSLQVFAVPGVVIDGTLKSVGRVPEPEELVDWLFPE